MKYRTSLWRESLHLRALLLERGVNVERQRGRDARVPEDLRERLGVKAPLDTTRGEGVAERVEGVIAKPQSAHQRLVAAVERAGLDRHLAPRDHEMPVRAA